MNKKTPLYQEHVKLGAKMCPFAGYDMPINYADGVLKEHEWVRTHAGLFDVSHMGQAIVKGAAAAAFFSRITPSNFSKLAESRAKYTVLTNDNGGIIDDLIITRMQGDSFFVVFNAGRKEVDIEWMKKNLPPGCSFEFLEQQALVALQGPEVESVLAKDLPDADIKGQAYMSWQQTSWKGTPIFVSRLGYTGEDGFEISVPEEKAAAFWQALLAHKEVKPIGLAARDSLRLEMGYPLYGHDLTETTTPVEAALSWVMSKDHQGYFGAGVLVPARSETPQKIRVGIKLTGPGIAREGATVLAGGKQVGTLTSGGFSPSLKCAIGQGYVESAFAEPGQKVEVDVRGKKIPAEVHALAFMPARTKTSSMKKAS